MYSVLRIYIKKEVTRLDAFLTQFEYLSRYVLTALAVFILLRCVISLFRLRPRREVMATLINLADDSEIEIENWETSIGRSRSCDIALKQYGTVSRFHAVLALRKEGWFIFDTESKTGVYLNGEQIRRSAEIKDGDTISFGNAVMRFQSKGYGEEGGGEIRDFTSAARLINLADNSMFYLHGSCLFGRDRHCNVCLPMRDISPEHAEVYLARDGWTVADLQSESGTYLNGELVFGAYPLYDGDIISLGQYSFMFRE